MRLNLGSRLAATTAVLVVVVTGCGDSSSSSGSGTSGGGGSAGAKACDAGNPVKIGAIFSLSGPNADIGKQATDGERLAVQDINGAGGILGRCVTVIEGDDVASPTTGAQVARKLIDQDNVDFIIGPFLSAVGKATIPLSNAAKKLEVFEGVLPAAGDPSQFPYVFRTETVSSLQAKTFVAYLKTRSLTKVGILAVNTTLGTTNIAAIRALAPSAGLTVGDPVIHETGQVDLTAQMRQIQQQNPQAVLLFSTAGVDLIAAVKARNTLNWNVPILGFSSLGNAEVVAGVTVAGMHDVYAGQAYRLLAKTTDGGTPIGGARVQAFVTEYKKLLNQDPLTVEVHQPAGSYDSFLMMATAINKVGKIDPDAVRQYLETNGYSGIRATYKYTATNHDGVTLDDLVFVLPASLKDGLLTEAPGQ